MGKLKWYKPTLVCSDVLFFQRLLSKIKKKNDNLGRQKGRKLNVLLRMPLWTHSM